MPLQARLATIMVGEHGTGFVAVAQDGAVRFWPNYQKPDCYEASVSLNEGTRVAHFVYCEVTQKSLKIVL